MFAARTAITTIAGLSVLLSPAAALAQEPAAPKLDTGDTAWVLTSTALVLFMTLPDLARFYAGLVRAKNALSTIMHSFFCAALVGVLWVIIGYSIAFGPTHAGFCGGASHAFLSNILGSNHSLAPTIPHILFVAFQMTFAVITPALISGAYAERLRFFPFAIFSALWSLLIYAPLAHWVWGGGWIGTKIGALDFAGGTVVHIASGISALVCALYLGKRHGYPHEPMPPHNLPMTVMGASMLWVGWFGFNAGSALGASELASVALINTNTAAAAAALAWVFVEKLRGHKPTVLGAVSGSVAGLVAITPGAGFVTPASSIFIGLAAGAVCYLAVSLKPKFGYDDALDVVGVHLVGGILGALLTGVFATTRVNPAIEALTLGVKGGLLEGHAELLWKQAIAVLITIGYCGIGTIVLLAVTNAFTRLRASPEDETLGLDLSQHRERAYIGATGDTVGGIAAPKSAVAPPFFGDRFSITLDDVDPVAMMDRWRSLCSDRHPDLPEEFKDLYAHVTTVRGTTFRLRGGDREKLRSTLERLFTDLGPSVRARIEPV